MSYLKCQQCQIIKKEPEICCILGKECCYGCFDDECPIKSKYHIPEVL